MSGNHHGLRPFKGTHHLCTTAPFRSGRFARLFHCLPPLYVDPLILHKVGAAGGKLEDTNPNRATKHVPAGLVFFGQFVDHDMTLDISSTFSSTNSPEGTENIRTPTLDLDCVYGDGPDGHPYLYDSDNVKLLTGADYADVNDPNDLKRNDLPRNPKAKAMIGDPRNDENRIISQLQLGFLRFHNAVAQKISDKRGLHGSALFAEARRVVTWHYQWVVVNDYLRTICGDWIVDDILSNGRKVYRPEHLSGGEPFIPIEFASAAYRYGHSMIPQKLRTQPAGPEFDVFGPDLGVGFAPITDAKQVVNWAALLDSGNGNFDKAAPLDAKLAKILLDLPFLPPTVPAFERSLAVRNLLRAQSFLVPSGEQIAQAMIDAGAQEITREMIGDVRDAAKKLGFEKATPLWIYVLAEGTVVGRQDSDSSGKPKFSKGEGLGPVGARFVAEVIIGLLELDQRSYLGSNRNWSPLDTGDKLVDDGVTTLYQLLSFK